MPEQPDLRESQQDTIARPQAEDHADDQASTLGVQIAGQNWLVDMLDISGVLPLPPLTPVPLTKSWFLGVVNVRGMLYGVTDMAAYQQKGKAPATAASRILLVPNVTQSMRHCWWIACWGCVMRVHGRKTRFRGKSSTAMSGGICGASWMWLTCCVSRIFCK